MSLIPNLGFALIASSAAAPEPTTDSPVIVSAVMAASELEVGGSYEFIVAVELEEGFSAKAAGVPAPILQLDVPPSVRLEGRYLKTHRELARNEFLQEPFERLLKEIATPIPFKLVAEPKEGETIGMNILCYVRTEDGADELFVRQRFELAVAPKAEAEESQAGKSSWGEDELLMRIGKPAVPFDLPAADGVKFDLAPRLGEGALLVTTYRAFW